MCDTWWYDIHHTWHTSVFFIISGAQMFMTYSERPVPTKTLMKNFFVSMAPLYYFTMAVGAAVSCPMFGPASYVVAALVAFGPWSGSAMAPTWYHSCQFYNVLFFNHIRWCIRWQRLGCCCKSHTARGCPYLKRHSKHASYRFCGGFFDCLL